MYLTCNAITICRKPAASLTLAYSKLARFTLGQTIALFEHRVFVEGAIWGINSLPEADRVDLEFVSGERSHDPTPLNPPRRHAACNLV